MQNLAWQWRHYMLLCNKIAVTSCVFLVIWIWNLSVSELWVSSVPVFAMSLGKAWGHSQLPDEDSIPDTKHPRLSASMDAAVDTCLVELSHMLSCCLMQIQVLLHSQTHDVTPSFMLFILLLLLLKEWWVTLQQETAHKKPFVPYENTSQLSCHSWFWHPPQHTHTH